MGIVNVTPDSFSDGGRFGQASDAVAHGLALLHDGADLIDVGGESTRPGAARVSVAEELARVIPVIVELAAAGATVSVDTMRAAVAVEALAAGAQIVNDVSGGKADPEMAGVIAATDALYVAGHWSDSATPGSPRESARSVIRDLAFRLAELTEAGVPRKNVILDPGIGFGKDAELNWALLASVGELQELGRPILVGTSRKRFLGHLLSQDGVPREVTERDAATVATSALAAYAGAWAVRVHEVRASRDAVEVAAAWRRAAGNAVACGVGADGIG